MAFGYLVVAIVAATVVVFSFQNGAPVAVRFFAWTLPSVSVAGLTLVALASGIITAGVPLWIGRWRLRTRVRALEQQVQQLETSLADRNSRPAAWDTTVSRRRQFGAARVVRRHLVSGLTPPRLTAERPAIVLAASLRPHNGACPKDGDRYGRARR